MLEIQRIAALVVAAVHGGSALTAALAAMWARYPQLTAQQRGAITDLSYGTLRFGGQLDAILAQSLNKALRDESVCWLLQVALYQLVYTRAAPHAIVDHAVRCAALLDAPHAGGLVNAILRNFLRNRIALLDRTAQTDVGRYSYPQWWIDKLREQLAEQAGAVLEAGNLRPPFTLRVNRRRSSRDEYLALLGRHEIDAVVSGAHAVTLKRALPVGRLPGFADGLVSVQDAAAQFAAPLLDVRDGMRVLDACAAPGGKTTGLLEVADIALTALDRDAARVTRVHENLARLHLQATVRVANAAEPAEWWDGTPFERILADVPCSASGVVRRHPDIKWLRRASDIPQFVSQQQRLLDGLWQTLARGGKLLYTTCSVFHEENSRQIADFLARNLDAVLRPLRGAAPVEGRLEGLLLPDNEHDGFFYALLEKK